MGFHADAVFADSKKQMENMQHQVMKKNVGIDESTLDACGFPVVLNIKLQENVYIRSDKDYVSGAILDNKSLQELAGEVWDEFGTTAILQSIPASWILNIECFEPNYRSEKFGVEKLLLMGLDPLERDKDKVRKILQEEEAMRNMAEVAFYWDMNMVATALSGCQF